MSIQQIGISDIQRNLHKLNNFDIVEIIDKKRGKVKGYFIDKKYAHIIQTIIKQEKNSQSTHVAGSLKSYADSSLVEKEESAWQIHANEKHSK